jgi:hypothetical protein
MTVMLLTRKSRSIVALLTAALLLLCQTAFAVQACAHQLASAKSPSTSPPCHADAGEAGSTAPNPSATTACDLGKAVADPAKVAVYAITDLPPIATAEDQGHRETLRSRSGQHVQAVCFSPPLILLHCRFLN